MAGNALEQEIIGLYSDNLSSIYSINQIATRLGKKYPYINKKVTILIKSEIFKKIVVGRSHLCSLNLKNDETIYMLILNEIAKKKRLLQNSMQHKKAQGYLEKLCRASGAGLAIYHHDKIIIVQDRKEDKKILEDSIIKQAFQGITHEVITKEELQDRLKEDKTLQDERTILLGFEKYYEYVREIEDELKLRYSKVTP